MKSEPGLLRRLPSMKALLFFNTVGKHLNLVRAGQELHLTQGALSRQLKTLEVHLGVELFRRLPRGLAFTEDGEVLYAYCQSAFDTLNSGLQRLSLVAGRQTLVVSVARSFALRVLSSRLPRFIRACPWVDLQVDTHRFLADLETSGADISIRLGKSDASANPTPILTDDAIWAVATPAIGRRIRARMRGGDAVRPALLRYSERDDWGNWLAAGHKSVPLDGTTVRFSDSATMLNAAEAGMGFCVARACLARDAIEAGRLVRVGDDELHDGLRYFAISTSRPKAAIKPFLAWLTKEFCAVSA